MEEMDLEILEQLKVQNSVNEKKRIGNAGDSGYVIVDGYYYDFYISAGIADNVTFDNHFNYLHPEIDGMCIDGTCNRPKNLVGKYDYIKKFVGNGSKFSTAESQFTTLNEFCIDKKNIFIKMDIEGSEWNWIMEFEHFQNVKQIVIECHGLFDRRTNEFGWMQIGDYKYETILLALKKLNKTHFLVHIHGNNGGGSFDLRSKSISESTRGSDELPVVVELTFLRKEDCQFCGDYKNGFPIVGLDTPNYLHLPEIILDKYPFKY
jgi:hypothetical protein